MAAERNHAAIGRLSQRAGQQGEDLVEDLNALCRMRGVARLHKIATPFRVIAQEGAFLKCVRAKRSTVDFEGVMLDGSGRHVAVEQKRCKEKRFAFLRLEQHQRDELAAVDAAGGVAVVLVVYGLFGTVHAIPWRHVAQSIGAGAKSMTREELDVYRVDPETPYLQRWARRHSTTSPGRDDPPPASTFTHDERGT